ncbi:MAG: M20 family metallopeptidase, partial [Clostridia bacterium]|nr:M20 family metallopeptidase [Clostridia bacterium]
MAAQVDFNRVDQLLEQYLPRMEKDLLDLLAFPSVEKPPDGPGAPFGRPVADALEHTLRLAAALGLVTENIDGYLGLARLPGASEEEIGVLSHLDVVPANAEEWESPPFAPQTRAGRIYGRGAIDDKGPLIATLYATLALAETISQPLPHTVTLMFGCNEESGCQCIKYYLRHRRPPKSGFSPDAEFPLIIGEKGIIHFSLEDDWPDSEAGGAPLTLLIATAGSAANIIPGAAKAKLRVNHGPAPQSLGQVRAQTHDDCLLL